MVYRKSFFILIFVLLFHVSLFPKIVNSVITVLDNEDFSPVNNAKVIITDIGEKFSNYYGRTTFESLKNGPYYITVKKNGYKIYEKIHFIVDTWKEIQVFLERNYNNTEKQFNVTPITEKDFISSEIINKISSSFPVSIIPNLRYLNKLIVNISENPETKLVLDSTYYPEPTLRPKKTEYLGDAVELINQLDGNKTNENSENNSIEYILGQPIEEKNINIDKLLRKKKKVVKPYRNSGILTVVLEDKKGNPVKGLEVSVFSMNSGKLLGEKKSDTFGRVIFYEIPRIKIKISVSGKSKILSINKTYTLCDFKVNSQSDSIFNIKQVEKTKVKPSKKVIEKKAPKKEKKWVEVKMKKTMTQETQLIKINKNMKFKW